MRRVLPRPRLTRLVRCFVGLVMLGVGLGLTVAGDLGVSPWDVLHQGLSERLDITIGTASIGVGVIVLLGWIPLRERPGIGTVMNVFVIGIALDLTLAIVETPDALWAKVAYLAVGVWLWGPGSGLYIGSGLGPGPRDGLMTGLARRGLRVGPVRSGIELSALAGTWNEKQLLDLVFAIGQYTLVSMALNTCGVQLDDGIPGFPA